MARRRTWGLVILAAAGVAAVMVVRRRGTVPAPPAPPEVPVASPVAEAVAAPTQKPTWLPPIDDACPPGHPVKVNTRSGIAHLPGGRFYDRTVPDRCYATAADAEADGYRLAKA